MLLSWQRFILLLLTGEIQLRLKVFASVTGAQKAKDRSGHTVSIEAECNTS